MSTLQARLNELARDFASSILDALKGASLHELIGGGSSVGNAPRAGRLRRPISTGAKSARAPGRLLRRSADDIAKALDQVVALVKKNSDGLRAEQIRKHLGLEAKEMPRVLKEGLTKRVLKTKGQKRATTYFAK